MAPQRLGIFALVASLILLTRIYAYNFTFLRTYMKFYGKIVWFC